MLRVTQKYVRRIRQQFHNPKFDYATRDLELFVDANSPAITVRRHIAALGFNVVGVQEIEQDRLQSYHHNHFRRAEQLFQDLFGWINTPISREILKQASMKENPGLVARLETDDPIKDILHEEFFRIFSDPRNVSCYALDDYLKDYCRDNAHVIAILQQTNLVAPLLVSPVSLEPRQYALSYHPAGRNGKLFGLSGRLSKQTKLYLAIINATSVAGYSPRVISNFCIEIMNHEFLGHGIMGLGDNHNLDPHSCLMATKRSTEEYIAISRTRKGLYLCNSCSEKLPLE